MSGVFDLSSWRKANRPSRPSYCSQYSVLMQTNTISILWSRVFSTTSHIQNVYQGSLFMSYGHRRAKSFELAQPLRNFDSGREGKKVHRRRSSPALAIEPHQRKPHIELQLLHRATLGKMQVKFKIASAAFRQTQGTLGKPQPQTSR